MKQVYKEKILDVVAMRWQMIAVLLFLSLGLNMLLTVSLFFKTDKVILVPQGLKEEVWVKGGTVSESYLREVANHFVTYYLTLSPQTSPDSKAVLVRHVHPSYMDSFLNNFYESVKRMRDKESRTSFLVKGIQVNREAHQVYVQGLRRVYMGETLVKKAIETYALSFTNEGYIAKAF